MRFDKNLAAWQKTWQKPGSLAKNLAVSAFLQLAELIYQQEYCASEPIQGGLAVSRDNARLEASFSKYTSMLAAETYDIFSSNMQLRT
jgi:hypothetical protein